MDLKGIFQHSMLSYKYPLPLLVYVPSILPPPDIQPLPPPSSVKPPSHPHWYWAQDADALRYLRPPPPNPCL